MSYVPRTLDHRLDGLLQAAPAVAVEGAKGVGKTATARERAQHIWMLDRPHHRSVLLADPSLTNLPEGTVLLDE